MTDKFKNSRYFETFKFWSTNYTFCNHWEARLPPKNEETQQQNDLGVH